MKRTRTLRVGLPPRGIKCHRADCGNEIAPGADAFSPSSSNNWAPYLHCSPACYAATFPHDPDVAAALAAAPDDPPAPPSPPAADGPELW